MGRILEDVSKWPIEKKRELIERKYKERVGLELNLDDPKRFTEKVQWRKLYEKDAKRSICTNKLTFKQYVQERIGRGYTAGLFDVWHRPEDVDLSAIPKQCVVKSNCASEGRYCLVVSDKNSLDIEKEENAIKERWFDWRYLNTNSFNSAYYGIKPCVLVEEYLFDPSEMDEYKFYCFDGEPKYLYRYSDHFKDGENMYGKYPVGIYTADWEYTEYRIGAFEREPEIEKPWCFDEMKRLSRILSKDFSFVRVDFFVTTEKLFVAELAFCPFAGLEPYHPTDFDYELGELWNLKSDGTQI